MKKFIRIFSLIVALMFVFCSCANETSFTSSDSSDNPNVSVSDSGNDFTSGTVANGEHPLVKFTMENGGSFVMELYPEYAPATVENFVNLVSDGFYDGLTFHRVCEGFMAQGGDPLGTGIGGSDKKIVGEFAINGYTQNTLSHTRGVVSMARSSSSYDSASSQFFICYDDATFLDGQYAAFGMVIDGMEVVDEFLSVERVYGSDGAVSSPVTPIVIEKAEVV